MNRDLKQYLVNIVGASSPLIGIAVALVNVYAPDIARPVSIGGIILFTTLGTALGVINFAKANKKEDNKDG